VLRPRQRRWFRRRLVVAHQRAPCGDATDQLQPQAVFVTLTHVRERRRDFITIVTQALEHVLAEGHRRFERLSHLVLDAGLDSRRVAPVERPHVEPPRKASPVR
jgi:hypothetical protein